MVDAWASRADDGRVDVLVWNGTLQQNLDHHDRRPDRHLRIHVDGVITLATDLPMPGVARLRLEPV